MISAVRGFRCLAILTCFLVLTSLLVLLPSARISTDMRGMGGDLTRALSSTRDETCRDGPKNNIFFLKIHKTGSSTLQNLLVRYAWKKKLLVGLPRGGHMFSSYHSGATFANSQMQPLPPGRKPNMLVHHMVFNHKEVASVLPSDAVYLAILRDPATKFESLFNIKMAEVKSFKRANASGGLKEFVEHPKKYFRGAELGTHWWFAKNGALYEFGYNNLNEADEYIDHAIHEIDGIFDLVLISEYFDMSLILLKDLLCWRMADIVHLTINARNVSTVQHVTGYVKKKIYEWNKAETAMYRHFNETFWKRVEKYGKERMERDLKELESERNKLANFCVEDKLSSNEDIKDIAFKKTNYAGIHTVQYALKKQATNNETCRGLILPEIPWWKKLSTSQASLLKQRTITKSKQVHR